MKKIIKGKVYDTDTAKECVRVIYNPYGNDFDYHIDYLYQKKTGEFFLHDERYGTGTITPLTYTEAQKWAEENLDGDEYIKIFGEPEKDESKVTLNLYIRKDLSEKLKQEAAKQGKTVSEYVEGLI